MLCFKILQINQSNLTLFIRTEIPNLFWLTIFLSIFILYFYGETHFDCHKHYPPIALENCTMEKKRRE